MTSKLKCPYCSADLESTTGGWEYGCTNTECLSAGTLCGTKELWQALIQSQQDLEESQQATLENAQTVLEIHKDLEIATKALKVYSSDSGNWWYGYEFQGRYEDYAGEYADKALKQIEHKE